MPFKPITIALAILISGCGLVSLRPYKQMAYAEAAFLAAKNANSETNSPKYYQMAYHSLLQARAAYRLKNFKLAQILSSRTRRLSEKAEFHSIVKDLEPEDE